MITVIEIYKDMPVYDHLIYLHYKIFIFVECSWSNKFYNTIHYFRCPNANTKSESVEVPHHQEKVLFVSFLKGSRFITADWTRGTMFQWTIDT